ncbi:MAG: hypothetical protein ACI84S_001115 [Thalassomonas sp.]|jgi:hypothetical protein
MKKVLLTLVLGLGLLTASAQIQQLAGPRIGMTLITAGSTADFFHKGFDYVQYENEYEGAEHKLGETGSAFTTQYGWQWESRFADGGGEVVGIVEWIALVAGMEQGKFLPSLTSVIGARTANGIEVGVGPSLSLTGVGMVFAIGKNFRSGSLNMPVNLVFMPGKNIDSNINGEDYTYSSGARISLMVGFNLAK